MPLGHGQLGLGRRWCLGKKLRPQHYDQAILLPNSFKSAITPFAARARRRTGFLGECRWGLLNDIRPLDKMKLPRTVDRFVALGQEKGKTLPVSPPPRLMTQRADAHAALVELGMEMPSMPVLGLCPGAEFGPAKRWPVEYYAAAAKAKLDQGWQVWLFGSDKDMEITAGIQALTAYRCRDLGGRTSLAQAIDLMSLTRAVISNDSGLMHIAAALDRPLVAVYGSSDPRHTPPLSDRAEVLYLGLSCSPCFKRRCPLKHLRCLKDLPPERVLAALDAKLAVVPA
jgi:heptosyltransferase-2